MASRARRLLLDVARSDLTFEERCLRGRRYLEGKCIHCGTRVLVPLSSNEPASATLEHIVPKHHGGGDTLDNLTIACARCNHGKGRRLDHRKRDDPALQRVVELLRQRRRERLRTPNEVG